MSLETLSTTVSPLTTPFHSASLRSAEASLRSASCFLTSLTATVASPNGQPNLDLPTAGIPQLTLAFGPESQT